MMLFLLNFLRQRRVYTMNLYSHQKTFLNKNPEKVLLCWDTGTGKTRAAIEYAYKNGGYVLIIVPKSVLHKWAREVVMWGDGKGEIEIITDRDMMGLSMGTYFHITTKEKFRSHSNCCNLATTVIVDEAHYFSSMTSQMSKTLDKFIRTNEIPRILLLTATPYMSTPWNIYTLGGLLGWKWSYPKFRDKFFEESYIGSKIVGVRKVGKKIYKPKFGIEKEMARLVDRIGDIVDIQDAADIPEQTFEVMTVKLNAKQRKAMIELDEDNPAVRFTKFHQIENGTLKGNAYVEDRLIKNEKLDIIKTYAEGTKKIAIICRYNLQVEQLRQVLSSIKSDVYVINGATKDKDAIVQAVEGSRDCAVVINASCSEGYELPSINTAIFASLSFSYKDYKQMLGRFLRLNKLSKNFFLHLITQYGENDMRKESVDEAVYQAVKNKQNFDIAIYATSKTT